MSRTIENLENNLSEKTSQYLEKINFSTKRFNKTAFRTKRTPESEKRAVEIIAGKRKQLPRS